MIKGETVILIAETRTSTDPFGAPIVEEKNITVSNVVVGTPSAEDVTLDINLSGKRLAFVLGIPKGDTNDWKDKEVIIRKERFRTYGFPLTQTDANVPGKWNTQVKVERYE